MATIYCRSSTGSDSNNGSTWALAKATLAAAVTAAGSRGVVYVRNDHAESQASAITIACSSTVSTPTQIYSVSDANEPPTTLARGANVSATGANDITVTGYFSIYGIQFNAGSESSTGNINILGTTAGFANLINCTFNVNNTSGPSSILYGGNAPLSQTVKLKTCTFIFGSTVQRITLYSKTTMIGCVLSNSGVIPTSLLSSNSGRGLIAEIYDCDFSAAGAGKSIISTTTDDKVKLTVNNCKIGSSSALLSGTISGDGKEIDFINCDSGNTNYIEAHYVYQGSWATDSTVYRNGGATDGVTPVGFKIVTSAAASIVRPMAIPLMPVFYDADGSTAITVTAEIAQASGSTKLKDNEVWIEVEYLGTTGYPLGNIINDAALNLGLSAGSDQEDSSVTWTGISTPVIQKCVTASVTPKLKGVIRPVLYVTKASTTLYVDPQVTVA
jgi:hypothetical protein